MFQPVLEPARDDRPPAAMAPSCPAVSNGHAADLLRADPAGPIHLPSTTPEPRPTRPIAQISGLEPATSLIAWRIQHWGTKWDVSEDGAWLDDGVPADDQGRMVLHFDTANSPAAPIVRHLIGAWPELAFELLWAEPANDEGGRVWAVDGEAHVLWAEPANDEGGRVWAVDGEAHEEQVPEGAEREWFLSLGWDIWPDPADFED